MTGEVYIRYYPCPEFNRGEILRYMSVKSPEAETDRLIDVCIEECKGEIKPAVCYTVSELKTLQILNFDSFTVESRDLMKNLSGCEKAVIFAATAGIGIDRLIKKYMVVSPSKSLVFQAIGAQCAESICDSFNEEIRKEYEKQGYILRPRFSPGYGDLSLSVQKKIFSVLKPEKIGITLSESLLMSPSKSVTAFIGLRREK